MGDLRLKQTPVAQTARLIRRPVADVHAAFIDAQITTKCWFTKRSDRLEAGKQVKMGMGDEPVCVAVLEAPFGVADDHGSDSASAVDGAVLATRG